MSKKFFKCSAHSNRDDDDDPGCLSTFIDIFDFSVKKYPHKLLSQRMSGCDKHLESEHSRRKLDFPSALDIILDGSDGSFHKDNELSTKDHIEDEMPKTIALQKSLRTVAKILKKQKHVNPKLIFGKECQSKELMEALQTLSLNKKLILKLIQDPNSITLQQIQDIRDDISENSQDKSKVIHLQQNESYMKIPSYSPLSHHIIENGEGEKTKSSFSFKAIRRKLIRAISKSKKEQFMISMDAVLDKIPYGCKDASCLAENNILSPSFSPLGQNINSDVGTQSTKDTIEAADIESLEEHYNLDVNTELVHDMSQKKEAVTDSMVSEPVESEAKAQLSVPLVNSPEYLQVEKLEFTEEGSVHASPVSVLEQYFLDDATSPKSRKTDNVVCPILPRKIDFQDQGNAETTSISSDFENTSTGNKKATYDFITELLQASNSYDHFIDQALFEETRIVHGVAVDDSKLYIDCLNEVIKEIKTRLSCFSTCVDPMKPNFSHQYYIEVVCNGIEWYLQLSQCTLYEMDMKEMTDLTWVNHKSEIEDIVIEVADVILEEMIMQIMLKKQADESYMLYRINDTVEYS